jgi:hypothetical protein
MARILSLLLSFVVGARAAYALESAPITTPHAQVKLASDVDSFELGKQFRLGLHFQLTKGWHIYWSNPGGAGAGNSDHPHRKAISPLAIQGQKQRYVGYRRRLSSPMCGLHV